MERDSNQNFRRLRQTVEDVLNILRTSGYPHVHDFNEGDGCWTISVATGHSDSEETWARLAAELCCDPSEPSD